ncbi:MAG: hypothetical protein ACR2G4_10840 [Pyrinomonadaceae bacterium]
MKPKFISLMVLLVLLASVAGVATSLHVRRSSYPTFTLHSQLSEFDANGNKFTSEMIRYVSSNGNFRFVHIRDGKKRENFFERGRGSFSVNFKDKKLTRDSRSTTSDRMPPVFTKEELLNSPNYNRTETLLGLTVYVDRVVDASSGQVFEYYHAPELGMHSLKTVNYDAHGKTIFIKEPISLRFGEPDPSLVKAPDYPLENL